MNDTLDDTDRRLIRALVSRDPGAVPASLRERVAAIPASTTGPGRLTRTLLPLRPAATLVGTAAAVLVGFVVISALRASPVSGPGRPNPTPGSAPAQDLQNVGFVLAVPIWLVVVTLLVALLAALLAVEPVPGGRVPRLIERPLPGLGWLARPVQRRLGFAVLAGVVLAGGNAASGIDALVRGSTWSPVHAHYMGSVSGVDGNRGVAYFRYVPGTTVAFMQTISNQSDLSVTVLGAGGDVSQPWLELRIFRTHASDTPLDLTSSVPFAPFTLAAHEEREVLFVVHIAAECPGGAPVPSPEPTPNDGDFAPPRQGGSTSFDAVSLRYSVLGLERASPVEFDPIPVIWSFGDTSCGFDFDWAGPSPSPSRASP